MRRSFATNPLPRGEGGSEASVEPASERATEQNCVSEAPRERASE